MKRKAKSAMTLQDMQKFLIELQGDISKLADCIHSLAQSQIEIQKIIKSNIDQETITSRLAIYG